MGPGDLNHSLSTEGLPNANLDSHGLGNALAKLAIEHLLLIMSELHATSPFPPDTTRCLPELI